MVERPRLEEIKEKIDELRRTNPDEVRLAEDLVGYERCVQFRGLNCEDCRVLGGAVRVESSELGQEERAMFDEAKTLFERLLDPADLEPEKGEVGDAA